MYTVCVLCSTPKACKPYITEAGPEMIDHLCDMRIAEASFLINSQPETLTYLQMPQFIRDSFMVLIAVPSQTFQLDKVRDIFYIVGSFILRSLVTRFLLAPRT